MTTAPRSRPAPDALHAAPLQASALDPDAPEPDVLAPDVMGPDMLDPDLAASLELLRGAAGRWRSLGVLGGDQPRAPAEAPALEAMTSAAVLAGLHLDPASVRALRTLREARRVQTQAGAWVPESAPGRLNAGRSPREAEAALARAHEQAISCAAAHIAELGPDCLPQHLHARLKTLCARLHSGVPMSPGGAARHAPLHSHEEHQELARNLVVAALARAACSWGRWPDLARTDFVRHLRLNLWRSLAMDHGQPQWGLDPAARAARMRLRVALEDASADEACSWTVLSPARRSALLELAWGRLMHWGADLRDYPGDWYQEAQRCRRHLGALSHALDAEALEALLKRLPGWSDGGEALGVEDSRAARQLALRALEGGALEALWMHTGLRPELIDWNLARWEQVDAQAGGV